MDKKYILLSIFFLVGLVYFNSLKTPFYYDDFDLIAHSQGLTSIKNFRYLFESQQYYKLFNERSYRPVTSGVYLLLKPLLGNNPGAWRGFNLLLHLFNCLLFYLILQHFGLERPLAGLAAAIFAAHTVHTEIFNVVSFNEDLLGGALALSAFYFYFKKGCGLLTAILFFLSCLAKETFVLLPVACLLFSWYERTELNAGFYLRQFWLWLAAAVFVYLSFFLMKNPDPAFAANYPGGTLLSALTTFTVVLIYYLKLFFLPLGLTPVYDFPIYAGLFSWPVLGSLIILGSLGGLIFYGFLKRELFAWFLSWFFLFLLPTSNVIPYGAILAERYLYFPLLGLVPGILLLFKYCLIRFQLTWEKLFYGLGLAFVALLSILTLQRNLVWQNPESLWLDTLSKTPTNVKFRSDLGLYYLEQKEFPKAIEQFKLACLGNPFYPKPFYNLGKAYQKLGDFQPARFYFGQAVLRKSGYTSANDYFNALNDLGLACYQLGDYQAALESWQEARKISPERAEIYFNLSLGYEKLGQKSQSAEMVKRFQALKHSK